MSAEVVPLRAETVPADADRYELRTVKEAAAKLGKTEAQLRWMIHTGDAPVSAMIGGRRMFRLSDIHAYIDAKFDEALAEQAG